jgi:hypothetical protein
VIVQCVVQFQHLADLPASPLSHLPRQ